MINWDSDIGTVREQLTKKVAEAMKSDLSCYAEVAAKFQFDITKLAVKSGQTASMVMACIVDDVEAGVSA